VAGVTILFRKIVFKEVDVVFFVAAHASGCLAEIADVPGADRFGPELVFMALGALDLGVLPFQRVAGEFGMVKVVLIDRDRVVGASLVLTMAFAAGLFSQPVEPALLRDKGSDHFVALDAFFVGNAFAGVMAFQAVLVFEVLVAFDQRARGKKFIKNTLFLRPGQRAQDRDKNKKKKG